MKITDTFEAFGFIPDRVGYENSWMRSSRLWDFIFAVSNDNRLLFDFGQGIQLHFKQLVDVCSTDCHYRLLSLSNGNDYLLYCVKSNTFYNSYEERCNSTCDGSSLEPKYYRVSAYFIAKGLLKIKISRTGLGANKIKLLKEYVI